jgi:predicted ATP-dependent endonuclease of OLD family
MYYQTIVTDVEKTLSQIYNDEKSINFFNTYCSKNMEKVENGYTLSLGEHYLLYLIQKVLTKPNILLIDTPESFLHIDLQIDLINNIKSFMNNSQLIVTTHSPEIIAEIDDENIYRINYIDNI